VGEPERSGGTRPAGSSSPSPRRVRGPRRLARAVFYVHLWIGIPASVFILVLAITGISLNHKRALGLMPEVSHEPSGEFSSALPLSTLRRRAISAVPPEVARSGVGRMDVRPGDGIVKVRFDDRRITEVTLDVVSGEVLRVGERNDQFLENLHSGGVFGDLWVLLSDAAAGVLLLLVVTGYWLWLYPKSRV